MKLEAEINLGTRERMKRRMMGKVSLAAAAALTVAAAASGAPRWWRLIVFLPLWLAGLGLFQARAGVCISLAARGVCNMDDGEKPVTDRFARGRLRDEARRIHRRALALAAAGTALLAAAPPW